MEAFSAIYYSDDNFGNFEDEFGLVRSTRRKRFSCSVSDSEFESIETYNSIVKLKKSFRFCRGQFCKPHIWGITGRPA